MRRAQFTSEQIVRIFKAADLDPIEAVTKRHCISEASIDVWGK